jgi:pilus assembly protein CpaF
MTGLQLPTKALRSQIASAINVVVQVERSEDGRRRLVSVQEINGMEGDIITMSEIFVFRRTGVDEKRKVLGALLPTGVVPSFHRRLALRGIDIQTSVYRP